MQCGPSAANGATLRKVLTEEWGLDVPRVLVSVVGDRRFPSRLSTAEQLELQAALSAASFSDSIWFVTTGWELGLAGLVGQCVAQSQSPAAVIGVSAWELLHLNSTSLAIASTLKGCNGRLRTVGLASQESHREKTDQMTSAFLDGTAGTHRCPQHARCSPLSHPLNLPTSLPRVAISLPTHAHTHTHTHTHTCTNVPVQAHTCTYTHSRAPTHAHSPARYCRRGFSALDCRASHSPRFRRNKEHAASS
jgi:hypothetical protein